MKIKFLKANYGDSILISIPHNGMIKNILIDGGTGNTFAERDIRTGRIKGKALKEALKKIIDSGELIDLLILTHVDDDHIGGLLKWFESSDFNPKTIKEIWFNSGQSIFQHFKKPSIKENNIPLDLNNDNRNTGIKQGDTFEDYIESNKIWDKKIIKTSNNPYKRFGATFTILSPTEDKLKALLTKWKKESDKLFTGVKKNDYNQSLEQLLRNDKFTSDKSKHNGSSIAFILEYGNKKFLFLGDAHAGVITKELRRLGYSKKNPLNCDLIKISHHGSKANTNNTLLDLVDTDTYVISANGKHHNLPNKKCLARIINKKTSTVLLFNYPELIKQIFSEDEFNNGSFVAKGVDNLEFN